MPNSYLMLNQLVDELNEIDGIVGYSLFQMPVDNSIRLRIFDRVLAQEKSIHFALETLCVANRGDVWRLNDIFLVKKTMEICPDKEEYMNSWR